MKTKASRKGVPMAPDKVVQELLRHASSRITQDIYQKSNREDKRSALGHMSGMFAAG
jgi:integrase